MSVSAHPLAVRDAGGANLTSAGIITTLNGQVVQKSDLSHLIFSSPRLIATVSEFTRLEPGNVIFTCTPSGGGYRRDPTDFPTQRRYPHRRD
ncbi:fumarylacetoacetate hydrolase family protein [Arthrobacter crystallopoietes]|uniref:fumarylacetoacetate hydrolase family protein n=1 Tax=Crystallibacter crystallopoietes TaxID=37928 RepID=UPI00196B7262